MYSFIKAVKKGTKLFGTEVLLFQQLKIMIGVANHLHGQLGGFV
jgi:hypothetical protein